MGRDITADTSELKQMCERLEKLANDAQVQQLCESCSKNLAAKLLELVIDRTPVGQYPEKSGKVGGTLRRGWTGGKEADVKAFVEGCRVDKSGDAYKIFVENTVEYASYVEYGHRTRGKGGRPGTGWVPGRFFLTISEDELERIAPRVLEKKIEAFLQGVFNGTA